MSEATASNAPVRRKPGPKPNKAPMVQVPQHTGKPLHSADTPQQQPEDISLGLDKDLERGEAIEAIDRPLEDEYTQALLMAEDHITIQIEPSMEENAPLVVDCWVNGKGAEVLDAVSGKFLEINCLPIGQPIVTKRKYVEVLARAKFDAVRTEQANPNDRLSEYNLKRSTSRKAVFSVLHDPSPKAREWLVRLMSER